MRKLLTILLIAPLVGSCVGSTQRTQESERRAPRPIKSVVIEPLDYSEREFAGLSTPEMEVNMAFKISGQILSTPVSKGDLVERGELLCLIDPRDMELQLLSDESNYEQARSSYHRAQRLLEHNAISTAEVERLESVYLSARSIYENSREMLKETTLEAPFRAIVERVYVDDYQRVQSGERVVRIVSPTTSKVEFTLPEGSLWRMDDSLTRFHVRFDNLPGVSFSAQVKDYARTSSDASGFPVSLQLTSPDISQYNITSGLSATITMVTPESNQGSILLPLSAIYAPISGGTYIWVVDSTGHVRPQKVEIEELAGSSSVVVREGVHSGERIATAGVYQLRSGDKVKIIE